MIIKEDKMVKDKKLNAFQGDGYLDITHILEGSALKGKMKSLDVYSLDDRCSLGKHFHVGETAFLYCLEGAGSINDNGEVKPFREGDGAIFKSGEFYSLRNGVFGDMTPREVPPLKVLIAVILDKHSTKEDMEPILKI